MKKNLSLLKNYLAKISKPELVAWLLDRCQEDERLRASLLDLVTPKEDAKALTGEKKEVAFEALQNRNKSVRAIAKALSVGEATIYRYQRELKEKGKLSWAT